MDHWDEWDLLSLLSGGAQYDPRLQSKMADIFWSPLGMLALFLFAAGTITICLTSTIP